MIAAKESITLEIINTKVVNAAFRGGQNLFQFIKKLCSFNYRQKIFDNQEGELSKRSNFMFYIQLLLRFLRVLLEEAQLLRHHLRLQPFLLVCKQRNYETSF